MEMISDALLIAGALGAAFYCRMLAKKLIALKNLDTGLGASIAALSRQVDEMKLSLEAAKSASGGQGREIKQLTQRAESAAGRLEMLLASIHREQRDTARAAARPTPVAPHHDDEREECEADSRAARGYAPHGGRTEADPAPPQDMPGHDMAGEDFAVEFEHDLEREREDAFRQRVLQAMRRGEGA